MNLTRKVAFNTIAQVIGRITFILISIVIIIYLTRYLQTAGYGDYNSVIIYLTLFATLADFGLWMVLSREMVKNKRRQKFLVSNVFTLRIILSIIACLIAITIGFFLDYPERVKIGILIFSLGLFFILLTQIVMVIFQVYLRADKIALTDVLGRAVALGLIILFIKLNYGFYAIIWATTIGFGITFVIDFFLAEKYVPIRLGFNFKFWKKVLAASWSIGIAMILVLIFLRIDAIFLALMPLNHVVYGPAQNLSNSETVGIYSISYRILDVILMFPSIFLGLVYPIFSRYVRRNFKKTERIFQRSFDVLVLAGVGLAIIFITLAPIVISILGGPEFEHSIIVARIIFIATAITFVAELMFFILVAIDKQRQLIKPWIAIAIFSIIIKIIMIEYYSYLGAVFTTLIIQSLVLGVGIYLVRKNLGLTPKIGPVIKIIFAGLISSLMVFLILQKIGFNWDKIISMRMSDQILNLGIFAAILMVIYLFFIYIFQIISKNDLRLILKK